ncbi:MAG UNVERIFIED_CONTAM: hypothetical protein LVR18_50495 [Planctomycetaceae bacterium]
MNQGSVNKSSQVVSWSGCQLVSWSAGQQSAVSRQQAAGQQVSWSAVSRSAVWLSVGRRVNRSAYQSQLTTDD